LDTARKNPLHYVRAEGFFYCAECAIMGASEKHLKAFIRQESLTTCAQVRDSCLIYELF
jgi:hypothetical protein